MISCVLVSLAIEILSSVDAAWFTATPQPDLSSAADADHRNATFASRSCNFSRS
jgi:hypothetical protein